ncbi:4-hydroxybenzoate synthetase [Paenibacillus enshidis]|uniref:4-hydroxybenzoate synthetase n=1 Tax=Paenibacillus enshidis TaxID=1458439 RepID=A0ABV5AN53_9BACL
MASIEVRDMDSALNFLQMLLFKILLITDGRTTDILETLMDESMSVQVLRQEQIKEEHQAHPGGASGAPFYLRESILIGAKSKLVVSHNIALVSSKHVPSVMFEAIATKQEGIGKTISTLGLQTSRKIVDYGWRSDDEAIDLFQQPMKLYFSTMNNVKTPYKTYSIEFGSYPGIYLLEYFNPDMIAYRLEQVLTA